MSTTLEGWTKNWDWSSWDNGKNGEWKVRIIERPSGIVALETFKEPSLEDMVLIIAKPQPRTRKHYRGSSGICLPEDGRRIEIGELVKIYKFGNNGTGGVVVGLEEGNYVFHYEVMLSPGVIIKVRTYELEPETNP
jgi:hypothetical protein